MEKMLKEIERVEEIKQVVLDWDWEERNVTRVRERKEH